MKLLKLNPVVKSYIWGGDFFQQFGKGDKQDIISELWELSIRGDNSSIVSEGEYQNKPLNEIITNKEVGPVSGHFPYFPLLIKLIDAKDNLSVQVHPSDDYALTNENSFGKTEMWHIISADEGCGLYVGFNKDYSKDEIAKMLNDGTILSAMNFFKVKPGDTFVINAGTVHAIGKGVRLIEIQQNSDLTYRLYDYNRVDKNGNHRELHIEKALKVVNTNKYQPSNNNDSSVLADNKYFTVEKKTINKELVLKADKDSFISFTFLKGEGKVDEYSYKTFDTFFLPYGEECAIKGNGEIIVSSVSIK